MKHGGVRNYIAVTWFEHDFEACLDLNLPCANVAHMLVEPLREWWCTLAGMAKWWWPQAWSAVCDDGPPCFPPAGATHKLLQHDFVVMAWIKPAVVLQALRQGYTVLMAGESGAAL